MGKVFRNISITLIFFLAVVYTLFELRCNLIFLRRLGMGVIFFYTFYWISSIFVFLYKRSLYSSYTSVIQRFWKRTLSLFWVLEFFLIFIYLYLTLIAPNEVYWFYDHKQLFFDIDINTISFFFKSLFFVNIIFVTNLLLLKIGFGNKKYNLPFLVFVTICLVYIAWFDFNQVYVSGQHLTYSFWEFEWDTSSWVLANSAAEKYKTITHYIILLCFLKFWHTVFIVSVWLGTISTFKINVPQTYNYYSLNLQNFFFLFFFNFLLQFILIKYYANVSYERTYFWFFINNFADVRFTPSLLKVKDLLYPFCEAISLSKHSVNIFFN